VHTEQRSFISKVLNPDRDWQCERCGSAQLKAIIKCSQCGNPNMALLASGGADGADAGGCVLM
jgi:hypothetical protein